MAHNDADVVAALLAACGLGGAAADEDDAMDDAQRQFLAGCGWEQAHTLLLGNTQTDVRVHVCVCVCQGGAGL
jgi:hypothetical protein